MSQTVTRHAADKVVLLADDEADVRDLLTSIVGAELGVVVAEARDGAEVLRAVERGRPALVLLDVRMSGLDGLAVTRRLKADPATRNVPVVAISAGASRWEALAAGCDDFVGKPFEIDELVAVLTRWLA